MIVYKYYPKYKQAKAREAHENQNVFNYKQFSRSSVKHFTDALFGVMPECNDIVETLQLMSFLLFEGQADQGWSTRVLLYESYNMIHTVCIVQYAEFTNIHFRFWIGF